MDSNTCLQETTAEATADTLDHQPNLITGRLKVLPTSSLNGLDAPGERTTSSYGMSRLGLVPMPAEDVKPDRPEEAPQTKERKKSTFKLSVTMLESLRNYAVAVGRYQYSIVTQALEEFLGISSKDGTPVVYPAASDDQDDQFDQDRYRLERDLAATQEALERTKARLSAAEAKLSGSQSDTDEPAGGKFEAAGLLSMLLAALWHRN